MKGFSKNWNIRHSKTTKKTRSIPSVSLSDKSTKIEKPKEIKFRSDIPSVPSMSRQGASITDVLPDK